MKCQEPTAIAAFALTTILRPRRKETTPASISNDRRSVALGSPMAAITSGPPSRRSGRNQPRNDQGALAPTTGEAGDSAFEKPTPPARNISL